MFGKSTRKIIAEHKWSKHSNPPLLLSRIKRMSHLGLRDMTLAAKELPEEQLEEIFTANRIKPLLIALLKPKNKRSILIAEIMAAIVFDKLMRELPLNMVNTLRGDIGKTWVYANLLAEYADKPLLKKRK